MWEWETIEKPGYFGKKRDELYSLWNEKYGKNRWRLAYQWGDLVIPRKEAIQIYEDGYYEFLKLNQGILEWLIKTASDVYDTAETNIEAKFDYGVQETPNNHIHDVSIRRAVMRLGKWFKGDNLMQVRWKESEGYILCPGKVPFHLPEMILPGKLKDYGRKGIWWDKYTIEDFYQKNKILQIKE